MRTLFNNGIIMDGSGKPSCLGHVIIEDDLIKKVGAGVYSGEFDGSIFDCTRKVVAPGLIDAHSHNDWFVARENSELYFQSFAEQGITTQITGNCGFSPFGFERNTPHFDLIGGGLFEIGKAEGDFSSFMSWQESRSGVAPLNLVPLLGHGTVRIGLSGFENRPLSTTELQLQNAKIEEAFDQGVYGLSFGLMYEPGRYATPTELVEAAKIVAKRDGILTVHSKAQSAASTSYQPPFGGEAHNLRALREMIELTRKTGVKMHYSHHIFVGEATWKTVDESLKMIDQARAEGLDFSYDLYSMPFGVSVISVILPNWYLSMPKEKRSSKITKLRLALELSVTKKILGFGFEDIMIAWAGEQAKDICGKRVSELAKEWKISELDAYIRVVELSEGKGRVNMYRYYNDEIIAKLVKHEPSLLMTDAWIEEFGVQNAAAYTCFPRFLELSREQKTISMEQTIRKMTGATADRFLLSSRGYLREGYAADITVFDPNTIAAKEHLAIRPEGINYVFVNGVPVVLDGIATQNLSQSNGLILRKYNF